MSHGEYDEALERLHTHGPEFDGFLSNHGPMVVETMHRRGAGSIHRWTDAYAARLDDAPRASGRIDDWRAALGDARSSGAWIALMRAEVAESGWSDVLARWWPRLLPGIAGGATHGVIRLGHALQAVREEETAPRVDEVAHALAYWATCWLPAPLLRPSGTPADDPLTTLARLPVVADQSGGIRPRIAQLATTEAYVEEASRVGGVDPLAPAEVAAALERIVDRAVTAYARWAPGNPTMLVHAATAPNAVRMALPSLPTGLWASSHDAAWSATAAVVAAYRPTGALEPEPGPSADTAYDAALAHGGEHVIKLADTALGSWQRTGDPVALSAVATAVRLDA